MRKRPEYAHELIDPEHQTHDGETNLERLMQDEFYIKHVEGLDCIEREFHEMNRLIMETRMSFNECVESRNPHG